MKLVLFLIKLKIRIKIEICKKKTLDVILKYILEVFWF